MFDGRDYHQAFEQARDDLAGKILDRDEVFGHLVGLEWTLWEAIRGAMFVTGNIAGLIAILPLSIFAWRTGDFSWLAGVLGAAIWLVVTFGLYGVFRIAVHYEIGRHVKSRRFGHLDFPWLPESPNYDAVKYPREADAG